MAFGLGVLRLVPGEFWAMTLHEITAAAEGVYGRGGTSSPLDERELAGLMDQFPDE